MDRARFVSCINAQLKKRSQGLLPQVLFGSAGLVYIRVA